MKTRKWTAVAFASVLLSASVGGADDARMLEGLVPGDRLSDAELGEIYGMGFESMRGGSLTGISDSIELRKLLARALREAGIRPPLLPSAGIGGGLRTTVPSVPRAAMASAAARAATMPSLRSIDLPRSPSAPRSIQFEGFSSGVFDRSN